MVSDIEFCKLSGSGNDFICIDNRDGRYNEMLASGQVEAFARKVCRRGLSVGADGIIFASGAATDEEGDIGARFFEPDGSEAELCGNGTGCFALWVLDNGWVKNHEVCIQTPAGMVRANKVESPYVRVCIPIPEGLKQNLQLVIKGEPWLCDYLVTGVPHVITYVENVDKVDVGHLGPRFRHHGHFAPRGANANFVQVCDVGRITVRTFEFGVEAETYACGTGSASAAILAAIRFDWPKKYLTGEEPVLVKVRSGDTLKVFFKLKPDNFVTDVCLDTVVRFIYTGVMHP